MEKTKQEIIKELEDNLKHFEWVRDRSGYVMTTIESEKFTLNEISNYLSLLTNTLAILGKSIIEIKMLDK